jgi:hypothetical protein
VKDSTLSILKPVIESGETIKSEQASRALDILTGRLEKPPPQQPERYMTLRAVAAQLGVSACSLWRWGVPGHALGGCRRFRMLEVQAYLESEQFRTRAEELREERTKGDQTHERPHG